VRKNLLFLVVLFCFANSAVWSQTGNTPASPGTSTATVPLPGVSTPKVPAEIMRAAAEINGLDDARLTPWHLKSTFQLYDFSGAPTEQGTYEEFWDGPKRNKVIYTTPTFTLTRWGTGDGKHYSKHTGGALPPKIVVDFIRSRIVSPVPYAATIAGGDLEKRTEILGNVKLICVSLSHSMLQEPPAITHPVSRDGSYCFGEEKPILRISVVLGGVQSLANTLALFQDRYVAKSVNVTAYGKRLLDIKIESLKGLASIQASDIEPPADVLNAEPDTRSDTLPSVTQGHLRTKTYPIYPAEAKRTGAQGTVVLEGTIGKDGRVHDLITVISPDPLLTEAALIAVRKWEYEPYLVNGLPVEIETEINVVFNLGR
jgi:TonB family protein